MPFQLRLLDALACLTRGGCENTNARFAEAPVAPPPPGQTRPPQSGACHRFAVSARRQGFSAACLQPGTGNWRKNSPAWQRRRHQKTWRGVPATERERSVGNRPTRKRSCSGPENRPEVPPRLGQFFERFDRRCLIGDSDDRSRELGTSPKGPGTTPARHAGCSPTPRA